MSTSLLIHTWLACKLRQQRLPQLLQVSGIVNGHVLLVQRPQLLLCCLFPSCCIAAGCHACMACLLQGSQLLHICLLWVHAHGLLCTMAAGLSYLSGSFLLALPEQLVLHLLLLHLLVPARSVQQSQLLHLLLLLGAHVCRCRCRHVHLLQHLAQALLLCQRSSCALLRCQRHRHAPLLLRPWRGTAC